MSLLEIAGLACTTCVVDQSAQSLLVVTLIAAPLMAAALGIGIARRLLRRLRDKAET